MKRILIAIAATTALLGITPMAHAIDGEAILRQVDRNLNPESYEMYRKLINIEPDGSKKEFVLYTIKKGQDKMVALFISPASEKGRSTLRLEDNMWLYMPNIGKPIRITSLQSIVGGVFTCGLWCLAMIWADRRFLPKPLQMGPVLLILNVIAAVVLTGLGLKAIVDYIVKLVG